MEKIEGFKRNTCVYKDDAGYLWISKGVSGGVNHYYRCLEQFCNATCVEKPVEGLVSGRPHNHEPNVAMEDHLRLLQNMRNMAANTSIPLYKVFSDCALDHWDGAIEAGGSFHMNKKILRGARLEKTPALPKTCIEFNSALEKPKYGY